VSAPSGPDAVPALRVRGLSKTFGATRALDDVGLDVERGQIQVLLGGNGSGKSTLLKALAGVVPADAGQIEVAGRTYDASAFNPGIARENGLHFVHQQSSTFPDLTVAENLAIGRGFERGAAGRIRWRSVRRRTEEVLARFEIPVEPDTPMAEVGRATQAMVAIARALQDQEDIHQGIVFLDEPTASLAVKETLLLLDALRRYAAAGQTIVLVTHRLREAIAVADRATVLRDGRLVETIGRDRIKQDELVELIMGGTDARVNGVAEGGTRTARSRERPKGQDGSALEVRDLVGRAVRGASFKVEAGELVGIAGLLGSGRTTLLRLLFGLTPVESGEIHGLGAPGRDYGPRDAMAAGVAYVPEDRADAMFAELSVSENLSMATLSEYWRGLRLRHGAERRDSRELLDDFMITAPSEAAPVATLSGGNQQKVVLARWLRRRPRVLLLDEPSQGVDIAARAAIYELIRHAIDEGACALVVCSDLEEIATFCDRALVMRDGRVVHDVPSERLQLESLERHVHGALEPAGAGGVPA
jgi:ribose transport system ATP-binding protein